VIFETGVRFCLEARLQPHVRLGYAGYREAELATAVRVFAVTLSETETPALMTAAP